MADMPKYAIFDDCDAPERRMIVELIGERYHYMVPQKWQPTRHRWMTPGRPPHGPTDIKTFGFETIETAHSVTFTRVCESAAKYPDGKPRKWQDRTFGANIGDSFEIPRRKR